jgi:predicted transposase YdaD
LEESVVYQDIFQKGKQQGVEQGVEQEARRVALRLLERRVGKLSLTVRRQIEQLTREQLEALCEALLDFQSKQDLTRWLRQDAPAH